MEHQINDGFSFITIAISLITGVIGTFIAIAIQKAYKRYQERNPFLTSMGIKHSSPTYIVIPKRALLDNNETNQAVRDHVTFEDMLAANYVERALTLAGLEQKNIIVSSSRDFLDDAGATKQNIVVICSPKENEVAEKVFSKIEEKYLIQLSFEKHPANPKEWVIIFDGATYESPSYKQDAEMKEEKSDYAVIARIRNPWNAEKSVILLCGIRGIGTWGAARYLRDKASELCNRSKRGDFIGIVKVTYENYKMKNFELTSHLKSCKNKGAHLDITLRKHEQQIGWISAALSVSVHAIVINDSGGWRFTYSPYRATVK
ncbi:MAG: hypothetical protein E6Q60_09295 [Nitrosomonas oligotropha]|uniref:Uncharacterized protein n=1 Tax=Nitrosomonas oligotropha TaxID=42354 RepID=A0A5C7VQU5_9PROT|nr:MAG: hypothetical protein E6Q60_09295 [Nitrosomonas oligotropha]